MQLPQIPFKCCPEIKTNLLDAGCSRLHILTQSGGAHAWALLT